MAAVEVARIAVLTVGDELLSGEVTDINFPKIVSDVSLLGMVVSHHLTVGDEERLIASAIEYVSRGTDAIIVTGGLGPTSDDVTREAVALATGRELELLRDMAELIEGFFTALGRNMRPENLRQAYVPRGATVIPPAGGTAPGFMLDCDGTLIAALPGVPQEMVAMLASDVLPELERRFSSGSVSVTRRVMTFGAGESDVAGMVSDLIGKGPVGYGFLVLGGPIVVKLVASAPERDQALRMLDEEQAKVEERLGFLCYGVDDVRMEEVVGDLLRESGKTLAVAESCTAGMVAARLTNVPGSSEYFKGGVAAYNLESKTKVLGIAEEVLAGGAVSREVAEEMALAAARLFSTDFGIGVTGVAGPGTGGEKNPVGTVCIALAGATGVESLEVRLPGDRALIRNIATFAALNILRLNLLKQTHEK